MMPWERRARERENVEERGALELIAESSSRERNSSSSGDSEESERSSERSSSSSGRSAQNLRGVERQAESESSANREESSREDVGADARARHWEREREDGEREEDRRVLPES